MTLSQYLTKLNTLYITGNAREHIGGYQPAQKWLKDRKGWELGYVDILHYQKMVVALFESDRIMGEIDDLKLF